MVIILFFMFIVCRGERDPWPSSSVWWPGPFGWFAEQYGQQGTSGSSHWCHLEVCNQSRECCSLPGTKVHWVAGCPPHQPARGGLYFTGIVVEAVVCCYRLQWGKIQNNWSSRNISDSLRHTYSKLQYSLKVFSFNIDAVLQAPELTGKSLQYSSWRLFSTLNSLPLWGLGLEKTSSQLVCLSKEERGRSGMVQGWDCVGWSKTSIFLSFKILTYSPCFVGPGIVGEKEDSLGGGDWTLAADLLDNFGQNCFHIVIMTL